MQTDSQIEEQIKRRTTRQIKHKNVFTCWENKLKNAVDLRQEVNLPCLMPVIHQRFLTICTFFHFTMSLISIRKWTLMSHKFVYLKMAIFSFLFEFLQAKLSAVLEYSHFNDFVPLCFMNRNKCKASIL